MNDLQRNPEIEKLYDLREVQKQSADEGKYNQGLYNGIELCIATLECREPEYK